MKSVKNLRDNIRASQVSKVLGKETNYWAFATWY